MNNAVFVDNFKLVGEVADASRIKAEELNIALLKTFNLSKSTVDVDGIEYREEWKEVLK